MQMVPFSVKSGLKGVLQEGPDADAMEWNYTLSKRPVEVPEE